MAADVRWIEKKGEGTGGGWRQENHLVILLSFLVARLKCALRSGASKHAGDEKFK